MNKKTLLGLSAVLFVFIGTLACSYCAGAYGARSLNNQGSFVLRAEGIPLPPFPWPWGVTLPSDARVS